MLEARVSSCRAARGDDPGGRWPKAAGPHRPRPQEPGRPGTPRQHGSWSASYRLPAPGGPRHAEHGSPGSRHRTGGRRAGWRAARLCPRPPRPPDRLARRPRTQPQRSARDPRFDAGRCWPGCGLAVQTFGTGDDGAKTVEDEPRGAAEASALLHRTRGRCR